MKVTFEHIYGEQERLNISLFKACLDLQDSRECEAVEQGWCIYESEWFQLRSTRINVSKYSKQPSTIKKHTVEFVDSFEMTAEHNRVYQDFISVKQFSFYNDLTTDPQRCCQLQVKKDGKLVAFSKLFKYDGALESSFTILDYKEPNLSIGRKIVDYEVDLARKMGYNYLYIGPGYNEGSIYKSNFEGFEWWTGKEWSTDRNKYIELCKRDSQISTLEELSKAYNFDEKTY